MDLQISSSNELLVDLIRIEVIKKLKALNQRAGGAPILDSIEDLAKFMKCSKRMAKKAYLWGFVSYIIVDGLIYYIPDASDNLSPYQKKELSQLPCIRKRIPS